MEESGGHALEHGYSLARSSGVHAYPVSERSSGSGAHLMFGAALVFFSIQEEVYRVTGEIESILSIP